MSLRYTNALSCAYFLTLILKRAHDLFLEGIYSVWSLSHPACFLHLHFLGFYTLIYLAFLAIHAHFIPTPFKACFLMILIVYTLFVLYISPLVVDNPRHSFTFYIYKNLPICISYIFF